MKTDVTVLIYTHNEEKNIQGCIDSVKLLSDNILVIDMESKDKTISIAKEMGAQIHMFSYSNYVEPAREFGIKKAKTEWVFILDADERITQELTQEIKKQITNNDFSYYRIPRKNIFGNKKWLKHGGWWPDFQIRLINTKAFQNWPKQIHSTPIIKGICGYLNNPIIHYFHGDLQTMVQKTIVFENIEADLLYKADKKVSTITFFRKFIGELFKRLIKEAGFLDGNIGIIESVYQAFSKTITYLFLYEKKNRSL